MFKKNIPNLITLFNLISGFIAILFIGSGKLSHGAVMILISTVFDFFDGTLARLLNARSDAGKQLDSLSDMVSFGVAPAFLAYSVLSNFNGTYVNISIVAILIPVFSAIRLALFNLADNQSGDFRGLAVPANAIMIASIQLVYQQNDHGFIWLSGILYHPVFIVIYIATASFLMVSSIPMFSLKMEGWGLRKNLLQYVFLFISLILLLLFGVNALPVIVTAYIIVSVVIWMKKLMWT